MSYLFIDVESTNKLWYWADLICVGIKRLNQDPVVFLYPDDRLKIEEILKEPDLVLIGHNIKYDLLVLKRNGLAYSPGAHLIDTVILSGLIDNRGSHKLVDLCMKYGLVSGGVHFDDLLKDEKGKRVDINKVPKESIINKNKQDLDYTEKLFNYFETNNKDVFERYKNIEEPFLKVLIDLEWRGINVNPVSIEELLQKYDSEYKERDAKLKEEFKDINYNSPKQLAKFFFNDREAIKKTPKGDISVDEGVLKELSNTEKIAFDLLEARKVRKIIKTYIHGILKYRVNDKIHPTFIQHVDLGKGTRTGRLSCARPNMQNFPEHSRAREIKKVFVPSEGETFINADLSQIELRLLAHYSKDKTLVDSFKNNADLHELTAKELFGKEHVSNFERYIGKTFNFAMAFGSWVDTLMKSLKKGLSVEDYSRVSEDRIKDFIFKYWNKFYGLKSWIEEKKKEIKVKGYAETLLGRKRYFDDISSFESQREGINSIIQGSAADIFKYIVIKLSRFPELKPVNFIHDSIVYSVPKNRQKELAFKVKREMIQSGVDLGLEVPLRVKITFGDSMVDL